MNLPSGFFWKIASCFAFAMTNGAVKYLTQSTHLPASEISFIQMIIAALIFWPFVRFKNCRTPFKLSCVLLHLFRVICAGLGIVTWYKSLAVMPIVQVVSLTVLSPVLSTLGGWIVFSEPMTRQRILTIIFGFIGGILVTHAQFLSGEIAWKNLGIEIYWPILASVFFSMSTLSAKYLAKYEPVERITWFFFIFTGPVFLYSSASWVMPSLLDWQLLIFLAFLAVMAHFCLTKALASADVTILMPVGAIKWLFSTAIGIFFFHESPNIYVWIGCLIIAFTVTVLMQWPQNKKK